MKINGNELRTGNIVEYQGRLMRAAKVHIVQMGNWRSFLQVELRDIRDGTKLNERIRPPIRSSACSSTRSISVPLQGR
jgi:elongation factor P